MTDKGKILNDAIQIINGERQDQYGDPEDSFTLIAEYWQVYLRNMLLDKAQDQQLSVIDVLFNEFLKDDNIAMMMVLFKIAREHYQGKKDNVVDAAGYLGIYGDKYDFDKSTVDKQDPDNEEWESDSDVISEIWEKTEREANAMDEEEEQQWVEKEREQQSRMLLNACPFCGGTGRK